jgi:hypothetical protein
MEDKRGVLKDDKPFSYRRIGDDKIQILFRNKAVFIAKGKDFQKIQKAIEANDDFELQMTMAKMTGNFKHGNERAAR